MYLTYLSDKIDEHKENWDRKSAKYLNSFTFNMNEGITYYNELFSSIGDTFSDVQESAFNSLNEARQSMHKMGEEINSLIEQKR